MKLKFKTWVRALLLFFALMLAWTWWAGAQTATNKPPTVATNQLSGLIRDVQRWDKNYLTFGLDRISPLRDNSFMGEPLWKYAASFLYVLLAFCVAKLIDVLTFAIVRRHAAKNETRLDDFLVELFHGPVKVVAFVVLLAIGLNVFDWPASAKLYLSKGLILIVAGSLTYLAIKIVNLLLDVWKRSKAHEKDQKFNDQLFSIIRKSLNVFIVIVAVLVTASNIGINITAAITSLSIGGLAVGLAAQDTLANLFGAVALFADKPFRVGDHIRLAEAEGIVESVGMRSTRVRNLDGSLATVPNKTMGNAVITNVTLRAGIKTTMNLTLASDTPGDKVKRALALLREIYGGHPMTQDSWISFNQFAGKNLNIVIVHWWKGTDYKLYLAGMEEMNLAVKQRFDQEGIVLV
jgi:MscS family membrane protein